MEAARKRGSESHPPSPRLVADGTREDRLQDLRDFRENSQALPAKVRAALAVANAPSAFDTELYEDEADEDDEIDGEG